MNNCFIFVEDDSTYNYMIDTMFHDVIDMDNFIRVIEMQDNSKLVNVLKKNKVQKVTGEKLNFLFARRYELYRILEENAFKYDNVCVLFLNCSFLLSKFPVSVLNGYRTKWKNIKYVLLFIDILNHPVSRHANYLREKGIFDLVYTVDQKDAMIHKLRLWPTPYSWLESFSKVKQKYNLYFCGVTKGRTGDIVKILQNSIENQVNVTMDVVYSKTEFTEFSEFKRLIRLYPDGDYIPYHDVLYNTLQADCILDIVQKDQAALTLRAYEAVCYNRKLITNNKTILSFSYFDPRYMHYYERIEDIDWEWIKADVEVNYGYRGDFSPVNLINDIEGQL